MNLYLVVSEVLTEVIWEDWFNNCGHKEFYRIAELVIANKRSQAIYMAWRNDEYSFNRLDIYEMPKMSAVCVQKDVKNSYGLELPEIVTDKREYFEYWGD